MVGSSRHNIATYGSHRRISFFRSSHRCPDSVDRSSLEELGCRIETMSINLVLLYFDPTATKHGLMPLPSIERSFRRQSAETCFRTVRGTDRHIIGHDIARQRNQGDCRLKTSYQGLANSLNGSMSAVGRGWPRQENVKIGCRGVAILPKLTCRCRYISASILLFQRFRLVIPGTDA